MQKNGNEGKLRSCTGSVCAPRLITVHVLQQGWHMSCLVPPLFKVPKGDWRCPYCLSSEVSKPLDAYGFSEAESSYSLISFEKHANRFLREHFKGESPTLAALEAEFWRLVTAGDDCTLKVRIVLCFCRD